MNIRLRNEITLEDQVEIVDQVFPVTVQEKNDFLYLHYTNEEGEKVVLKCNEKELVMTRFSTPKSLMRFLADKAAIVTITTPLGLQHFKTVTRHYQLSIEKQVLTLAYELQQLETDAVFASYHMEITWE